MLVHVYITEHSSHSQMAAMATLNIDPVSDQKECKVIINSCLAVIQRWRSSANISANYVCLSGK